MVRFSNLSSSSHQGNRHQPAARLAERIIALDARIVLHDPDIADDDLPRPSIRPYPIRYSHEWNLPDGTTLTIRPVKPEDEPMMIDFTLSLSPDNLYLRYFHSVSVSTLISHEKLTRLCFVDYNREISLVAVREDPKTNRPEIIAHGQLTRLHGRRDAEFAVQVRDQYQGSGLGTTSLRNCWRSPTRSWRRSSPRSCRKRGHAPRLHQVGLRVQPYARKPELPSRKVL